MEKEIEKLFVDKFIKKECRERRFYELSSKKKREEGIINLFDCVDNRYVIFNDVKSDYEGVLRIVASKFALKNECYIIAERDARDGTFMPAKQAIEEYYYDSGHAVLLFGEKLVFIKTEPLWSSAERKVLFRE